MAIRRANRRLRESGLIELMERCTFASWAVKEPWQKELLSMAKEYAETPDGWFYLAGRPGTGKTHLCTAICSVLLNRGLPVRYLLWRDFAVKAKAVVNDEAGYRDIVEPMKRVKVLYIDDFLKTGKGEEPTIGDVNLAFELINDRYNDRSLVTIISSELTAERLLDIDEATGSRVYERAKRFYADLSGRGNWRLAPKERIE